MTTVEYPVGIDLAWIACDRHGEIAVFYSAGPGPIPKTVLELTEAEDASLETFLLGLPIVCGAEIKGEFPSTAPEGKGSFNEPARQGCYVFDWSDVHRARGLLKAYERCALPLMPLTVETLPVDIQTLLRPLTFADIAFRDCPVLDVEKHFECLLPPPFEPIDLPQQPDKLGVINAVIKWTKNILSTERK